MIWLTWRQHRAEALAVAGGLAVALIGLAWLGISMAGAADQLGLGRCTSMQTASCTQMATTFESWFPGVRPILILFVLVPPLLGMFVGAPLVAREVERGTQWLVWAQSVGRRRWLLVKLAGVLLLGTVAVGVLTAVVDWAVTPLLRVFVEAGQTNRLDQPWFDVLGVVPVAYTVFALALGVAAGALVPRVMPAMALVLVVFFVVRMSVFTVRSDFEPPLTMSQPASSRSHVPAGSWVTSSWLTDPSGRVVDVVDCGPETGRSCAGYTRWITYQPADRYWPFQAIESGFYVVLSVLLLAGTVLGVRRR